MLLYTVTIACRLKADGDPDFSVDLSVEDGVPAAVWGTIPAAVQNVGKQMAVQLAAGDMIVRER